jgi:DNA-binding PadR family transcriptional regulator
MHGYRLKAWLERYMSAFLTANYGAIYPLLRRLERQGLIRRADGSGTGPNRTVYEITPAGRERWRAEMLSPQNDSWLNARARFMTRFWFFGSLAPAERCRLLGERLAACREKLAHGPAAGEPDDGFQQALRAHAWQQLAQEVAWLAKQAEAAGCAMDTINGKDTG